MSGRGAPPGEFALIRAFLRPFGPAAARGAGVLLGPGDDCALVAPGRAPLALTTDALVEDVHFRRATFAPADVGHKALAVNLSDLAAMGARPAWALCALGLPPDFTPAQVAQLGRGMAALARAHRVPLVGGNVTAARELSVTLTLGGHAPRRPLRRDAGRPGDVLLVSGTLGGARLGLLLLEGRVAPGALGARVAADALARQRRPTPRVALGAVCARHAACGLDVSDGLAQDAGHLARASGLGVTLELARLPVHPGLAPALGGAAAAARAALAGGEDYELLIAAPPAQVGALVRAAARVGERLTPVGHLTRGPARVRVLDADGRRADVPAGFDHRRRPTL